MIKQTITYTDFDGNEVTEDFFFHLTKAEITELNALYPGGLEQYTKQIVAKHDESALLALFKVIIAKAYGEKSEGHNKFIKRRNGCVLADEFIDGEAYSALFEQLVESEEKAKTFFEGLLPKQNPHNA